MTNLFRIFLISLASAVAWFRGSGADWGAVSPVPRKLKPPVGANLVRPSITATGAALGGQSRTAHPGDADIRANLEL